jgi:hypothetical protein
LGEQEEEISELVTGKIQLPEIADGIDLPTNSSCAITSAMFVVTVPSLIIHRRDVYEKSSSKEKREETGSNQNHPTQIS